jgi:hypothetical protein
MSESSLASLYVIPHNSMIFLRVFFSFLQVASPGLCFGAPGVVKMLTLKATRYD